MFQKQCIRKWVILMSCGILMMLLGTVYTYSVFRVALEKDMQIGATQSGYPYMIALSSYAVLMWVSGKHLTRYQPRRVVLAGGLLVALGWLLSSYTSSIYGLSITYGMMSGAGVGIAYGIPLSVIARWFPEKKGFSMGLVLIGFGASPLIMAPLLSFLIERFGVMLTFRLLGALMFLSVPLLALPMKYPNENDERVASFDPRLSAEGLASKEMLKTNTFKGLYVTFIIGTMIGLSMIGMTLNVGLEYTGLKVYEVTLLTAFFAIFNGVGRPLFGWLTDTYDIKSVMRLSFILNLVAAVLLLLHGQVKAVFVFSFSLFWLNLGGWLAIAPTSTMKLYGMKHYSANYGIVFTAYGFGALLGILGSGVLKDYYGGYQSLFYVVMVLCGLGLLITQAFMSHHEVAAYDV